MRGARVLSLLGALLALAGSGVAGYGAGRALPQPSAPSTAPNAYLQSGGCAGCPAGTSIDSLELQRRQGSLLVVLRGHWPASVDALTVNVVLHVGDVTVGLQPHGTRNVFEATAARGGAGAGAARLPATSVAAALQGGAVLVDLAADIAPAPPLRVDAALAARSGALLERVPLSGELTWSGQGAPQPASAASGSPSGPSATPTPTPTATPAASTVPSAPAALDPSAAPRACSAIPSGRPPPYLTPTGSSSGVQTDPRTHVATEQVTVSLAANPASIYSPAHAIVAVVLPAGATAPSGQAAAIDSAGTVQLYAFTDGTKLHKAIRTFADGAWHALVDGQAGALTIRLGSGGATLYWTGLRAGDRFGFATATASGCGALGLDPTLTPTLVVAG